jgi:hypothetical protein
MNAEEHIRRLSERVAAAPDGSEEFALALAELRAALKANSDRGRAKIAALQNSLPRVESR